MRPVSASVSASGASVRYPISSNFNKLVARERLAFRGSRRHASDDSRPRSGPVGPHLTRIKVRPVSASGASVSASGASVRHPISTLQHTVAGKRGFRGLEEDSFRSQVTCSGGSVKDI